MLSKFACEAIAQFQNSLKQLEITIISVPLDQACLKQSFQQLKATFETEIMGISHGDFDPPVESLIQSYLTETHKQMRLLEMDIKFLQAARQSATFKNRLIPIQNCLNTLLGYCEDILKFGDIKGL
ncbi:MAG: heterocyst frequency control protein PatD [Planktothrix sp. GU0601_MAG3]|nr:MAG: heterocyst frequency control protein PatD [Planktothrix sp. GU0601_MAG3]